MFITQEKFKERITSPENLVNINEVLDGLVDSCLPVVDTTVVEDKQTTVDEDISDAVKEVMSGEVTINSKERRPVGVQGKVKGDQDVPTVIRDIITIQSNFDRVSNVAQAYGVSPATVSNLKYGIPDRRPGQEDNHRNVRAREVISSNVHKIRGVVEDRILFALGCMSDDKIIDLDAKGISQIVKNLSGVGAGLEKKDDNGGKTINVQTIFYSPGQANVADYEVIDVADVASL